MVNVGKYTIHGSYGNSSRSALQSANEITTASIRLDSVQTKQQSIKAKEKIEAKVTCPLNNDHLIYTQGNFIFQPLISWEMLVFRRGIRRDN